MAEYMNSITALARGPYEHTVHELVGWDGVGLRGSRRLSPEELELHANGALTIILQVVTLAHSSHAFSL